MSLNLIINNKKDSKNEKKQDSGENKKAREEKIKKLQKLIENEEYQIDSESLAECLLDLNEKKKGE